jgi:hypothetical protein
VTRTGTSDGEPRRAVAPGGSIRRWRRNEAGSALVVVPVALALAAALALGVGRLGVVAERRAAADAVADLVALAAVTGSESGARAVAEANGAAVESITADGGRWTVEVQRSGVRSRATAAPAAG